MVNNNRGPFLSTIAYRLPRREIPYYIAYGLGGLALFNVAWSTSVAVNKAAVATALLYCAPVFVALGAWALYHERVSAAQGGAIVINLTEYVGVSELGVIAGCGMIVAFVLAVSFLPALLILLKTGGEGEDVGIAALGLLPWGLLTQGSALLTPRLDLWGWLLLLGLSLGPTLAGYALFTASLAYLFSTTASLLTTMEPPITAVLALVLLGRAMSPAQWLGTALIVASVLLIHAASRRRVDDAQETKLAT